MTLSLRLGMTIGQLQSVVTPDEVAWYAAYVEKYGTLDVGRRVEVGMATVATAVYNANGVKKKSGGQFNVNDFLIHKPKKKPLSDEELLARFKERAEKWQQQV